MNGTELDKDIKDSWLSTYGLITAKRTLERYKIKIADKDLFAALKKPNSFYQRLLKVPMNNIKNGIIMQQGKDYQVFLQKMLIDYLLSGESDKREEAQGSASREEIEQERQKLVLMDTEFRELELIHENLIAKSQTALIKSAEEWLKSTQKNDDEIKSAFAAYAVIKAKEVLREAMSTLISVYNFQDPIAESDPIWKRIEEIMEMELTSTLKEVFTDNLQALTDLLHKNEEEWAVFMKESADIQDSAKSFRKTYASLIIKLNELIQNLPNYKPDSQKTEENKESLYFDASIGEG